MGLFHRSTVPPDVTALTKKGEVKGLLGALKFKADPAVRRSAAEALGALLDFKTSLHLADFTIRMTGLQNIDPPKRRGFIADNLRTVNEKNPSSVQAALASMLRDADPGVRASAARAIGRIWCGAGSCKSYLYSFERWFPPDQFTDIVRSMSSPRSGGSILGALIHLLQDGDEGVRKAAVEALESAREASSRAALSAVAERDPSQDVRDAARGAMARIGA